MDTTSAIEYSPFNPGVWFTGEESGVPGLFVNRDGGQLTVHRKNNNKERQALFLHMHNATGDLSGRKTANGVAAGDRAQVVKVAQTIHDARFTEFRRITSSTVKSRGLLPVRLTGATRTAPSAR